jgi:hypothetical protein
VTVSSADRSEGVTPENFDGDAAGNLGTVAQLAVRVIAPAVRGAGCGQATRMETAGTDNRKLKLT